MSPRLILLVVAGATEVADEATLRTRVATAEAISTN